MKRLWAIFFSLLLVWAQTATAVPAQTGGARKCCCCDCQARCCVAESTPAPQPPPAAPLSARAQIDFSALPLLSLAWVLPASDTQPSSRSLASSPTPQAEPLYTRLCALLI